MNDVIRTILARQSVRADTGQQVSDADLSAIVDCGLHAATALGKQP